MAIELAKHRVGVRRGFSLLEVMVALAILTISLVTLVEIQSSAVVMTREAENMLIATDLAEQKLTEARLLLETDGFKQSDVVEQGDFSDLGDDVMDLEFGKELEDYKWEYSIQEIDFQLAGDIAGMAQELEGSGFSMGLGGGDGGGPDLGGAGGMAGDAMSSMGMGTEQITEQLAPYVREIRVRVWWGDDSDQAEEDGTEVVVTSHAINPVGPLGLAKQLPQ